MPKSYTAAAAAAAAVGKATSVICVEEVFDDGYQPSNDGELLQYLHPFSILLFFFFIKCNTNGHCAFIIASLQKNKF